MHRLGRGSIAAMLIAAGPSLLAPFNVAGTLTSIAVTTLILDTGKAHAQVVRPLPPARPPATRDTTRKDSTKADTTKTREIIKWVQPDSVERALLSRQGYDATRYQGVRVRFDAKNRTLYLEGDPAGVGRGPTILVGDTIVYNDSTKIVVARGDTLILRDPSQGTSDMVAKGELRYNVAERRGNVTNISTAISSGENWIVKANQAGFVRDSTRGQQTAFYARNGSITSCDDSIPDYHFQAKEIKMVSKNLMVARPAVLYIGDVPVMWLPFIFQDMRSGRRSGILTPRFGLSEVFRNSPTYRRHLENLGYYFAFNDYTDGQVSLDWRSGANSTPGDPGWVRINGEWRYRWLNRFLTGRLAVTKLAQRDGSGNTAYSWAHQQDFSQTTHLTTDINYVTNTVVQRQTTFDPRQVLATIQSRVNYQQKVGPATFSIGGDRRQYPGRDEVTQNFPNFSISTPTIAFARWLEWTPSLNVNNQEQLKVNRTGEFAFRFFERNGVRDSAQATADSRATNLSFATPIKIFGFNWQNSFRVADQENNAPARVKVVDPLDPTKTVDRVFAKRFSTEVDWQTSFGLPTLLSNSLKLAPSVGISNVDSRGYWVRTEQSGGAFVHQSKRLTYSLSSSPTLFGLFPGIGAVTRFRHSISPRLTFQYAPAKTVGRDFLAALNVSPADYVGSLAQNQVSLALSTDLEAKLRPKDTSATAEERKLKVLSVNFSSLSYDFERKRKTGRSGFTNDFFSYDLNSDLLPGFRLGVQYSLFQGSVYSDTAVFKPFRTGIDASFSVNSQSGIFAALTRIFGKAVPQGSPEIERLGQSADDALGQRLASTPVAGSAVRNRQYNLPQTQGWQASFTFNQTRQRPPVGSAQIIEEDPRTKCISLISNPFVYDQCVLQQQTNPVGAVPIGSLTGGGPFVRVPNRETLGSQVSFHITPKWSAQWGTTYDFEARQFAAHNVTLQRELHDWRSIFAFTRGPNGNFAFNFFIALNAEPDIKFNYDKATYRQAGQ
jgi:lipopolysaccharide assembly outer membrane protein LptD (OstA)